MKVIRLLIIGFLLVFSLCQVVSASSLTNDSTLSGLLGSVPLHAEAVLAGGYWTYTYTADISALTYKVTGFDIANLEKLSFYDASNNKNFLDPVYTGLDAIIWRSGSVIASETPIIFSFKSIYEPKIVDVTMWGGPAFPTSATTFGLTTIPEPGTICVLIAGLGFLGLSKRKNIFR